MIEGLAQLKKKLGSLVTTLKKDILEDTSDNGPRNIILDSIREAIDSTNVPDFSGHLKNSFIAIPSSDGTITFISTARYASYLNFGTAPSVGRYVPFLHKRLHGVGYHPGNRPYNFMEKAEQIAATRISESANSWINRALQTAGLA